MSVKRRVHRLERLKSLEYPEGYVLLIEDDEGNLIDGSGQIYYTREQREKSREYIQDLSQADDSDIAGHSGTTAA